MNWQRKYKAFGEKNTDGMGTGKEGFGAMGTKWCWYGYRVPHRCYGRVKIAMRIFN